jgi:subtilisin family serine protease
VVVLTGLVVARLAAGLLAATGLAVTPASTEAAVRADAPRPGITVPSIRSAEQSQLAAISAPAAWPVTRGSGVTVAVLDTGVDAAVPDLAGSVTTGPDETAGIDPRGYRPPHLHGTYIASLIAGHGSGPGRRSGIIGIAPAARILSVREILDNTEPGFGKFANESVSDNTIGPGIRYAVQHGASVINMSLGSIAPTQSLRAALAYAAARGVVLVAAAGNDGAGPGYTPFSYPAAIPGVIAVAAVSRNGDRAVLVAGVAALIRSR